MSTRVSVRLLIKFIFEFNLCISAHLRMSCVNHYGVLARKMIDRHKMIGKRRVSQIRRACAQTRFGVQVEGASVVSAMLWKERATRVQRDLDKKKKALHAAKTQVRKRNVKIDKLQAGCDATVSLLAQQLQDSNKRLCELALENVALRRRVEVHQMLMEEAVVGMTPWRENKNDSNNLR